jgi:hypothetical protein
MASCAGEDVSPVFLLARPAYESRCIYAILALTEQEDMCTGNYIILYQGGQMDGTCGSGLSSYPRM